MNSSTVKLISGASAVTLILGLGIGRYFVPKADSHEHTTSSPAVATAGAKEEAKATIWTCSMHPQIRQPEPGKCPICGMDLIPLVEDGAGDAGPRTMSMSESSRALAEIQTSVVERAFPVVEVSLVGKLDYDETKVKSLTARFPARVDDLFVNFTGVAVSPGEHLARVYSPELLTAQRELLTANRSDPASAISRAAREKLRLWDLQADQIEAILERGEASDQFELRAPIGGVVVTKNVKEGDYVKTGEPLFRIVDLSQLWLHLDAYESDLPWLRYGQDVAFTVEAFPGETFHGRIAFIAPEVDRKTRTVAVRVNVPNTDHRLKPGMFARGEAEVRLADSGNVYAPELAGKWISPMHPEIVRDEPGPCPVCGMPLVRAEELGYVGSVNENEPLVIPSSAVLRTGKRAVVYVEKPNAERPTFEGREIQLGPRAGDVFLVVSGLTAGERVVSHGAFKIDSALQIQAKPSMMNPTGGGPAPGHNHGGSAVSGSSTNHASVAGGIEIPVDTIASLLKPYLALQSALANDDLAASQAAARAMMEITGHSGPLPELLHEFLSAGDLSAVRNGPFARLSSAMIAASRQHPTSLGQTVLVMHCPMALDGAGADWMQASEPLQNPYFGAMMLTCGETTETISATTADHNSHAH